jgi:acyl carrier protein
MTDNGYAELVERIFRSVSERPLDDIGPETRITDLGVDSVAFAEVVVQIEEALDIEIPFGDWLRVRTVREVLEMIEMTAGPSTEKGA